MSLVLEQRLRRDSGSVVSAVRIGISGGGFGWEAHLRVWVNFVGLRPARARVLSGEDGVL